MIRSIFRCIRSFSSFSSKVEPSTSALECYSRIDFDLPEGVPVGMIAGNGPFPFTFAREASLCGHKVVAVCHKDETDEKIESLVSLAHWIRVGELGTMIKVFKDNGVKHVAMAGGISRVKHFGEVKLDFRGSALLLKLRSTKDDVIMRGIADELLSEGIQVIPCTVFLKQMITPFGLLTKKGLRKEELEDVQVGKDALLAMSDQDIGQLVVVREGVIVAVEASEGTNQAILRGGDLGGKGTVIVKCAKATQDMRFDVPTVGISTIEVMEKVGARVLALEAGRSLILDKEQVLMRAEKSKISILGISPLVGEILAT
jgi:UDP-2,3-diacylglucosamine hydrolase